MSNRIPNFFLIGAMKAGTTSLYEGLRRHPDIFFSSEKEPFYFVWSDGEAASHFRVPRGSKMTGADHWMVIRSEAQYRALFAGARGQCILGDASTFYLPHPRAAERIRQASADARIVAVLRDPAERAYSAFTFQRSLGLEPRESFRQALQDERAGLRDDWLYGWRYLYCGRFGEQLEHYVKEFGEDRVMVLEFGELKRDLAGALRRIFIFLGLDPHEAPPWTTTSNRTLLPQSPVLRQAKFLLSRPNLLKDGVKTLLPLRARRRLKQQLFAAIDRHSQPPRPMDPEDRAFLIDHFRADRELLASRLGWDLSGWAQV
ncbi:hypothetical protein FHS85_003349 [Rhodoligotrophos appendicifer]|uniref:sulfotransferase family protein n=1 Tax=Rhodoligotrophos appendicifer TaxID=987056 RepID=UPI0011853515|nr:sulfotransferase [Rhodoligotrophos appendicifer]